MKTPTIKAAALLTLALLEPIIGTIEVTLKQGIIPHPYDYIGLLLPITAILIYRFSGIKILPEWLIVIMDLISLVNVLTSVFGEKLNAHLAPMDFVTVTLTCCIMIIVLTTQKPVINTFAGIVNDMEEDKPKPTQSGQNSLVLPGPRDPH